MAVTKASEWRKLPLSLAELCIETTLRCGQSFRWRKIDDEWHCALHGRIVSLKQDPTHLHYRVTRPTSKMSAARRRPTNPPLTTPLTPPPSIPSGSATPQPSYSPSEPRSVTDEDTEALLRHYLTLTPSLQALYAAWSKADPVFASRAPRFAGVRILSQDSWEALVAFICSSNNNIARISQMVRKLCEHWGPYVGSIGTEPFHDFPTPEALSGDEVEPRLRELGFGYRAKYIAETARAVAENGRGWLDGLRNPEAPSWGQTQQRSVASRSGPGRGFTSPPRGSPGTDASYKAAHATLLTLAGVGPKVADCVCLMGLGWLEAVPVDTHVWQIAQRDYRFRSKGGAKTFNRALYDAVGDHFRALWGEQAGWAHSVLFTADLKAFADRGKESGESGVEPEVEACSEVIAGREMVTENVGRWRLRKRKAGVKVADKIKGHEDDAVTIPIASASKRRRTRR